MNKKNFNAVYQNAAVSKFAGLLERLDSPWPNLVRILTYHQIDNAAGFEQQMDFLTRNYYVASMPELIAACQGHTTVPPRSVAITFDDAYQNFAECAWPILKARSLSATIFVPTAFPGDKRRIFWWDMLENALFHTTHQDPVQTPVGKFPIDTQAGRVRAYKKLRVYVKTLPHNQALAFVDQLCDELDAALPATKVLDWDALRRLAAEGVTLGTHTQTHPLLNRVSIREVREEVAGSLKDLQRETNSACLIFAYPAGGYTKEVVEIVKESGYCLAFTTQRGTNNLTRPDRFLMRRNNIGKQASLPILRARLLQASVYLDRLRPT